MKRFLFVLVLLAVGTVFLAERVVWLRDAMPWLPHWPWGQTQTAATTQGQGQGGSAASTAGQGGGRRGGGAGGRGGANGPTPVLVAQAHFADLPVTADVLGTVQATNTVTVKSQVDGKLIEVDFQEGQDVKKGDILARVDPSTFQATYDQAVAKKAQDDSILANAQVDLARYQKLAETQYGSHQQADTQKALVTQDQAIVQQDQAQIDSAKTTLNYATVRSPIDGRAGIRTVDQGNIVHSADSTGIVTVAQVKPIAVLFSLPQQYLRQVNVAMAKGPLRAEALEGDNTTVLDTGVLQVVDNSVDQTTGTVKLKGSFPNAKLQLWPGQFVNIRLYIDMLSHVVVVPTSSVQRGPDGTFVYLVANGSTVAMRKVTVGRQTEQDSVITAGLAVPDTVVTTGFTRLTDGAKVSVSSATASAEAPDTAASGGPGGDIGGSNATPAAQGTLPVGQRNGQTVSDGQVETRIPANPVAQPGTGDSAPDGQPRQRRNKHARDGGPPPAQSTNGP